MAESLRDQLAANFDKITTSNSGGGGDAPVDAPIEPAAPATPAVPPSSRIAAATPAAPKPAVKPTAAAPTDDRPRDAEGKFVKAEDAPAAKTAAPVGTAAKIHPAKPPEPGSPQAQAALPAAAPVKQRPPRPSSWKKEYWDQWEQLDPSLAEYLHTRESQYASGVSAYKAEAEQAKPIMEAMQPFMSELQQHRIEPGRWITELGHVHRILALGAPAQKLQTLARVAQAYGVPLQALYDQQAQQAYLQQGQFQQPVAPLPQQPQQRPLTAEEADKLFQQKFLEVDSQREIERFAADATKHPHYDEVRQTMSQLLEANLADDLESAYDAALKHPRHAALWQQIQEQDRAAQEEARRQQEQQRVLKAKGKAVSTASATPSGGNSEDKPKGLRSSIESAFEQHAGGGRV